MYTPVTFYITCIQIVPTLGGQISVIRGSDGCSDVIEINKPMSVAAVAADLIMLSPGLQFVVATDDGTLMCIGHKRMPTDSVSSEKRYRYILKNISFVKT